jgi:threonine 3-dehydrogenase
VHTALSFDLVGEDVLVSGAGPIGDGGGGGETRRARNVVITDVNEYRLELARKMGVTRAVNVAKENLNDVMAELGMTEGSMWVWRCPARRRRSAPCSIP